jgi:superfamily II DNA or RNA helicase
MTQNVQQAGRVLTHMGYAVRKETLSKEQIAHLTKHLTVTPNIPGAGRFAKAASPFTVFMESPTRYYLPRFWTEDWLGPAEASILQDGLALRADLKFVGNPYDYQTEIINTCFKQGVKGLLSVPCGRGKTFMAIAIAHRLGRRFLVVVDKEFLLQQWSGELKALLPGVRIGILQGPLSQVGPEYDVTICMLQTLVMRDFPNTVFPSYGLTIFDECHHLGAAHFSRALLKVQTKHMIGLSATPKRDDGLTKVFEWFLGKPFYWEKVRKADPGVVVKKVSYHDEDEAYTKEPTNYMGEVVSARLLTQIVEYVPRNEVILKLLLELCAEEERKILVLSERISHLKWFEERLGAEVPSVKVAYYIGGMKEGPREEGARTAKVLLASYQMASEAMNIKALNAVIMASPRKKIEQSTGRILRTRAEDRKVSPLIIDVVDSHDSYRRRWSKRRDYYMKCGYTIEGDKKDDDPPMTQFDESESEDEVVKVAPGGLKRLPTRRTGGRQTTIEECLILNDD